MASSRISDLINFTTPLTTDVFPIADLTAAQTKKVTLANLIAAMAAVQATQETGTSTILFVTPGVQQFHPSSAKCWGRFNTAGAVTASYNITSVTDTGTGVIGVTIATDFSGAGVYAAFVSVEATATTWAVANAAECHIRNATLAAGTVSLDNIDNTVTTNLVKDPASWHFAAYGDQ